MELQLDSPVQYVPRVGPSMAGKLQKRLGIATVWDLLMHVPFRYDDFSVISPIARIQPGTTVTVTGALTYIRTFVTKNGRRMVMAGISDDTGSIDIVWFNQQYLVKILHAGDMLSLSGKADWFGRKIVLTSPVYELLHADITNTESLHTGRLVPVYPETEGITSKWLRGRIDYILTHCLKRVTERLPQEIIKEEKLLPLSDSIRLVHFPDSEKNALLARKRLAFDELFGLIARARYEKHIRKSHQKATAIPITDSGYSALIHTLPFMLTDDQKQALKEIFNDIAQRVPMNRLLEGDVGAGKTVVAAGAIYAAITNGKNALFMAPTQILAQQHAQSLSAMFKPFSIPVHLIIGGKKPKRLQTKPSVIIGTHALLTSEDIPPDIALIVIDEQQRFGVWQRAKLRTRTSRKTMPHQLIMTATPIPRTLAQTVFGDLDISVLNSMPKGRTRIQTWVVPEQKRGDAYAWIEKTIQQTKGQVFIICPFIDESETLSSVRAASTEYAALKKVFPHRTLALLHGKMKQEEKSAVLDSFSRHATDILVSTPVVEVGIDIPNATIMVIEAANRFGLSQLHQLRGRVGRGAKKSYCLLFTQEDSPSTTARLKALETVHNGPELAELDLTLRGPGELFGTRQHGVSGLTLATLTDTSLVLQVQHAVDRLCARDPSLSGITHLRQTDKKDTIDTIHA